MTAMTTPNKSATRLAANWSQVFPPAETPADKPHQGAISCAGPAAAVPPAAAPNQMVRLKGLSLRQPWAEQIMRGEKTVEYRQRPVKLRGRIYVYASLGRYSRQEEVDLAAEVGYEIDELPRGVVIGTVE